jgi:hypothetical protein
MLCYNIKREIINTNSSLNFFAASYSFIAMCSNFTDIFVHMGMSTKEKHDYFTELAYKN